ncbi:pVII [Skunk adenovirus 1]|uniref:PVII n=1 Tax=Skunk adenovirus 1 TaxID=2698728 RepID=A0A0K0MGF8_9ADEN|nr:pVII [Skunk adenovirus PB1]QDF59501.1 pVII [African pygmy hedgehog adenovirus 1]QKF54468.1 pVII [Skunk adenovirus HUN/2009]UKT59830.1 pVII [Raccoon adenovirus]UKT59860.1 pVII [Porcupine adenovirus]UWY10647.1 pVII [Skunk adenovirus 1]
MAILISPSNNTGWGLGTHRLFGGAKQKSDQHPVYVQAHYRAQWGSLGRHRRRGRKQRRRVRFATPLDPQTAAEMAATIDEVARNGPPVARTVLEAARRVGAYDLRRTRKLTPAGRALMQARIRRLARAAPAGTVVVTTRKRRRK